MPEQPDPQPPSVAALAALRERLAHVRLQRDGWRQRAEEAERALAQARDAIADERRGRLAAEAAVRRVRELHAPEDDPRRVRDCKGCRTHATYTPYEDCKTIAALDAEQPKETPRRLTEQQGGIPNDAYTADDYPKGM